MNGLCLSTRPPSPHPHRHAGAVLARPTRQGPDTEQLRRIIAAHVKVKRWFNDHAEIECPGSRHHQDTWVRLPAGQAPYVHCFKDSCRTEVAAVNEALREAVESAGLVCARTEADLAEQRERKRLHARQTMARQVLQPQLLAEGPITVEDWLDASPVNVRKVLVPDHWRLVLELFRPHVRQGWASHIWCGAKYETTGAWHFRPVDGWLQEQDCPGPQVCQAVFLDRQGVRFEGTQEYGRSVLRAGIRGREWASHNPWLVLESDILTREQFGRVIVYVADDLGLPLKAVVDTGGKSLHAWFIRPEAPATAHAAEVRARYPDAEDDEARAKWPKTRADAYWTDLDHAMRRDVRAQAAHYRRERELLATLKGLGCDPDMWRLASCARLPGCVRLDDKDGGTGEPVLGPDGKPRWQRLIYYDPQPLMPYA